MRVLAAVALALVVTGSACSSSTSTSASSSTSSSSSSSASSAGVLLTLDPTHDYGNKYADGILPVGDGKYTTDAAAKGSIFVCHTGGAHRGGARTRGPGVSAGGTTYDSNKKVNVEGAVHWDGNLAITVTGDARTITTNDLPKDHTTGVFPVATSDPAHAYDPNPNTIKAQSVTYSLPASPTAGATPHC